MRDSSDDQRDASSEADSSPMHITAGLGTGLTLYLSQNSGRSGTAPIVWDSTLLLCPGSLLAMTL